jgi:hypothetical protein
MRNWKRKGGRVVTKFDRHEAALLRELVDQVTTLLTDRADQTPQDELAELTGIKTGPSAAPTDPLLARLLPDFHRLDSGDPDGTDQAEFADSAAALRSLHEPQLIESKTGVAAVVLDTLPESGGVVAIDDEQAASWLAALNDIRLALGTAIGVDEDMPDRLPDDDPRAGQLTVYHWLTWMQESLLNALTS